MQSIRMRNQTCLDSVLIMKSKSRHGQLQWTARFNREHSRLSLDAMNLLCKRSNEIWSRKKTEKVSSNIQRWWLNFVHILFRRCFFFLVDWKVIFLLFCRLPWQMKFECGHSWRITSIFNQNTELHQPKSVNANEFKPNEWVCFFGFWSTFCCQHFGSTFVRQFHLKYSVIKFYVRQSCLLSITRQTQMPKTVEKFIAFFCMTLKSKTIFKWIESKMIWHWIRLLFSSRTKREKTHFTGKSLEIIDASVERKKNNKQTSTQNYI